MKQIGTGHNKVPLPLTPDKSLGGSPWHGERRDLNRRPPLRLSADLNLPRIHQTQDCYSSQRPEIRAAESPAVDRKLWRPLGRRRRVDQAFVLDFYYKMSGNAVFLPDLLN